jgi:hypothetical protein
MDDDDVLILGGLAVLAVLLLRTSPGVTTTQPAAAAAAAGATATTTEGPRPCDNCGDGQAVISQASPVSVNRCFLGNCEYQAILDQYTQAIEASNAQGNWPQSWQISYQRDAWVKSVGG